MKRDASLGQDQLLVGMYRRAPAGVGWVPLRYPNGDATESVVGEIAMR